MSLSKAFSKLNEYAMMLCVAASSLALLLYVGFGDGKRTYEHIQIEKLTAQGLYIQNSLEKFVRDGLPLKQYAGFSTLAAPVVEGEEVDAVLVYNQNGKQLFAAVDKKVLTLPSPPKGVESPGQAIQVVFGADHYQILLPLRSRFETVGSVLIVAPTLQVMQRIKLTFLPLVYLVGGLSALFALIVVFVKPYIKSVRIPLVQTLYGTVFLVMAGFVISSLVDLYFDGLQSKARATAFTLSQRLSDIVDFKLNFKDFDGIDRAFRDNRKANPEISEAAVIVHGAVEIATDSKIVGKPWQVDSSAFEYKLNVSRDPASDSELAVTVPVRIVWERVGRSVKNFAALFIAAAFLSALFLQVAASLQQRAAARSSNSNDVAASNDTWLVLIKPVYFLGVFLDSLTYSFLPKYMQDAAASSGLSVGFASAPFTIYYLCFALSLIPAGTFCERRGPKTIILWGLLLAAGSVLCLALPLNLWEMTALRGIAGIGQGMLVIGIQGYILLYVSPEKKTQGMAIIVFGFQGGLISGMALGSLFVAFLHPIGVFAIAGGVGVATLVYTLALLPGSERKASTTTLKAAVQKLGGELKKVVTDFAFLQALLCIGAPAKAILTGVITFAIPLVLGQLGYRPEDIGQIVMLYGLGVVASSGYVSRLVDRTKNTESILFAGAVMSGAGLAAIGLLNYPLLSESWMGTALLVAAVTLVGVAHGFINAPVVTHVGQSELAKRIGANSANTAYRFLERSGHVAGPLLLSQLFIFFGQGINVISGFGVGILILGFAFVAHRALPRRARLTAEPAE
jgi:MFS family permease